MSTSYSDLNDITEIQVHIMQFVTKWVKEEKTPVPLKQIIAKMKELGFKDFRTSHAVTILVKKGFIRKAISNSNSSSFVQLRNVL